MSTKPSRLDFSNYVAKSDLKKQQAFIHLKSEVDKLNTNELKNVLSGLNILKCNVDKLDVDKLQSVPVDSKKLSDAVEKDVVKKNLYDELVKKLMLFRLLILAI